MVSGMREEKISGLSEKKYPTEDGFVNDTIPGLALSVLLLFYQAISCKAWRNWAAAGTACGPSAVVGVGAQNEQH